MSEHVPEAMWVEIRDSCLQSAPSNDLRDAITGERHTLEP